MVGLIFIVGGTSVHEIKFVFASSFKYFQGVLDAVNPIVTFIISAIVYVMFPEDAYKSAAIGLCGAVLLDILTKYYSISSQNNGLKNALEVRAISSDSLWVGIRKKIVDMLIIMILCGLSIRVTPLEKAAVFLSTVAYSAMFLKECQSIIENLIDAGHTDLQWMLFWLKKKRKQVLEADEDDQL